MGNIHVYLECGKNYITNNRDITKSSFSQLLLFLFSFKPCISKTANCTNLKLGTQVGFYDGMCNHMLIFSLDHLVSMETVTNGFMQYIKIGGYFCM